MAEADWLGQLPVIDSLPPPADPVAAVGWGERR
jgi:hypothetical protein